MLSSTFDFAAGAVRRSMHRMRSVTSILLLTIASLVPIAASPQSVRAPEAATITIRLSSFAFTPERIRLRVGVPVHFHLQNESSGGHDFSAPALFSASVVTSGLVPSDGTVEVSAGTSVDITLVPRTPGTYQIRCTHFLHSLFGMTGTIFVEG
ncbi:MAG TPA: cupredoxin domain-containing protein [Acetobacteraceae bacterium]|nr:cupredoxin domain-containing protein [Acetobacteraceae bacterium]